MSPFNKKPEIVSPVTTIIGPDTVIEGEIRSQSSVRVGGKVVGRIVNEGDVYVAEGSLVCGDIHGKKVTVAGEVEGNISAAEFLEITSGGKVSGDIKGDVLSIQEGATFRGRVNVDEPVVVDDIQIVAQTTNGTPVTKDDSPALLEPNASN